ncbi:MAG: NAD(P)/FAD-dependent oxidoreductase [Pseudomonadales bacterium]|nr:NAD(P)/FAD-dependent oxidoreductase [Pseudomonadales bacterium]
MSVKPDVLVIGAGFAGMYTIYCLRKLGLQVQVLEAGTNVGGTWYWNRYPGSRCDVPSLEYSFGFSPDLEQEWDWPEVFSAQPDILKYANHIADRFDLRRSIRFNTRATAVTYLEHSNQWQVDTDTGTSYHATYCIMATGCLSVPNTPNISGAELFQGETYHTGLWPKDPVDLSGKKVGIIGTGSSGVQAIPELARQAQHLTVFQRTPVYTVPANRKRMRKAVQDEFKENYRQIRAMQQNNRGGVSTFRPIKSVKPGLNRISQSRQTIDIKSLMPEQRQQQLDQQGLESILGFADIYNDLEANEIANDLFRHNIKRRVKDPQVAEKLLPKDYGLGCKRQVLDRDYYDTFNRDNVLLVDVQETPIRAIDSTGVQTTIDHHELDVLIYATGFDAMTGALLNANITGRNGQTLQEKWQFGPVAYLGLQMNGFPNLFTVTGPGSPSVLCNMLVAIEQHINWISKCIVYLKENGISQIEPSASSELTWISHVNDVAKDSMFTAPTCNSWYLGANIPDKPRIFMPYVGGFPQYREHCETEQDNHYPGFTLRRSAR